MAFTKPEMQDELMQFMQGFAHSVERMYGGNVSETLGSTDLIKRSYLWRTVNELYEYGIAGVEVEGLGKGHTVDASHADAELFLRGLDSFELYLEEDQVKWPRLALRAVQTAIARHVLEGGERYTLFEEGDYDMLSIAEIALLADMDERSVRNAASKKVPGALQTESVGKRSMVSIEEARRWLAGRKGFVPTHKAEPQQAPAETADLTLPAKTVLHLAAKAAAAGLSVAEYIEQHIANAQ